MRCWARSEHGREYDEQAASLREQANRTREKLREQLREGRLDQKQLEIDVREKSFPSFEIIAGSSVEEVDINVKDMMGGLFGGRTRKRRLPRHGGAAVGTAIVLDGVADRGESGADRLIALLIAEVEANEVES